MYVKTLYFVDQWDKFKPLQIELSSFPGNRWRDIFEGNKKKLPFKYYTYQEKTGPYPNSLISNILDI